MIEKLKLIFRVALLLIITTNGVSAAEKNQFITIVNPVRISKYTADPAKSINAQYSIVHQLNLPATWLLTYDILDSPAAVEQVKKFDKNQELGIFLEVSPAFASSAGVKYNESGDWHYAKSVFLSGYLNSDRITLIDKVFTKFKDQFGYYPTSVGSWWTDAYSLSFMKEKYDITANLGCADQFQTDGYQLWGQYWSIPFYPNRFHPAMPASSDQTKLDLVTFQWAARDPYNGYKDSLYSTQDYFTKPSQGIDYFAKLVRLYASQNTNDFGQITVGLEGDFAPESYQEVYLSQLRVVRALATSQDYQVVNMSQFSQWYRNKFPGLSPPHLIYSSDLLGTDVKSIWYQSPNFRIGLTSNEQNREVKVIDYRRYSDIFVDPYLSTANSQRDLFINIPSTIDSIAKPNTVKTISSLDSLSSVSNDSIELVIKGIEPLPPVQDLVFRDIRPKIPFAIRSRLGRLSNLDALLITALILLSIYKFIRLSRYPIAVLVTLIFVLSVLPQYFVSQYEVDALKYLSSLEGGNIMVYDRDCLNCKWSTPFKPAALANKRNYVAKLSGHPVVYDNAFQSAADSGQGKLVFKEKQIRYLYLVKYDDYIEDTHFSPLELNLTKVYETPHVVLWKFNEYD